MQHWGQEVDACTTGTLCIEYPHSQAQIFLLSDVQTDMVHRVNVSFTDQICRECNVHKFWVYKILAANDAIG